MTTQLLPGEQQVPAGALRRAGFDARLGPEQMKELRRPFQVVKFMPQGSPWGGNRPGCRFLAYLDSSLVAERLSDVDPSWEPTFTRIGRSLDEWKASKYATECALTVCGVTRTDVGYGGATEPMKAAYSDALKRAAWRFGVGSYLRDDSWDFKLDQQIEDNNGRRHEAYRTKEDGSKLKFLGITPAGRAALLARYHHVLTMSSFKDRYGEPVDYGDQDIEQGLEGEAVVSDDEMAAHGQVDTITAAELEVLLLVASYNGRRTSRETLSAKLSDATDFERELTMLMLQVRNHLELTPDEVEDVRKLATQAVDDADGFTELSRVLAARDEVKES